MGWRWSGSDGGRLALLAGGCHAFDFNIAQWCIGLQFLDCESRSWIWCANIESRRVRTTDRRQQASGFGTGAYVEHNLILSL